MKTTVIRLAAAIAALAVGACSSTPADPRYDPPEPVPSEDAGHEAAFERAMADDAVRVEAAGREWRYDSCGTLYMRRGTRHSLVELSTGARADFDTADTVLVINGATVAGRPRLLRAASATATYAITGGGDTSIVVVERVTSD